MENGTGRPAGFVGMAMKESTVPSLYVGLYSLRATVEWPWRMWQASCLSVGMVACRFGSFGKSALLWLLLLWERSSEEVDNGYQKRRWSGRDKEDAFSYTY